MIASVRNSNIIARVASHVPGIVEASNLASATTKASNKRALFGKDLDAMVVLVSHDDFILKV